MIPIYVSYNLIAYSTNLVHLLFDKFLLSIIHLLTDFHSVYNSVLFLWCILSFHEVNSLSCNAYILYYRWHQFPNLIHNTHFFHFTLLVRDHDIFQDTALHKKKAWHKYQNSKLKRNAFHPSFNILKSRYFLDCTMYIMLLLVKTN